MSIIDDIESYYNSFCGEKGVIGKSVNGNPIYFFTVRKSDYPIIIAQYSIHAREYITSYLALKQIERFMYNGKRGTVHFLPLLNPDGAFIAQTENGKYKANARGVDLNVNFDARWGKGKSNVKKAGAENFIGEKPFSEPETVALRDFTLKVNPTLTLSYHSKGEEIYWEFFQDKDERKRDYKIAAAIATVTGYAVKSTPDSCGGYKDWCIEKLGIPAFTIEVGDDREQHPLNKGCLEQIYLKNERVVEVVINSLLE
ncbi:MAG: hypothetical protein E7346_00210 [Clostridiales bacterium]|nr:hypothetical protein [Clostridiales bacterium]